MDVVYCLVVKVTTCHGVVSKRSYEFAVAMRPGVTPVPIPNTMVKTRAAESTALETMWEDRWPLHFDHNADRSAIRFLKEA